MMKTVSPEFVRALIDFAPTEETKRRGFAESQLEGTAALFNMLSRNRVAYLADEVGMGKTFVALGVMSLLRYFEPTARIIVIAPRENIQRKWIKELRNFVRLNWQMVGNRVKSLQGGPVWEPVLCHSLMDFSREALINPNRDFFLRMTSFSLTLRQEENRKRLRRQIRELIPWINTNFLSARSPEGFREAFGCALNAAVPETDLVIVDEAHNLKYGYQPKGSVRNHVMGLSFGNPEGASSEYPWYGMRAKRVLLLSATPFEEDYEAIRNQFDIFGFKDAKLYDSHGKHGVQLSALSDHETSESQKREVVDRIMVRRVSGLRIEDTLYTKNMYRREWRNGGFSDHDQPIEIKDPKQRLIVGLMQKKVSEVLQDEKFNNHFQIGMLSSFESFLESVGTSRRRPKISTDENESDDPTFDGDQGKTVDERQGVDTSAISIIVESYRNRFQRALPHPKLDTTAHALSSIFDSGEKFLLFVRRVATVDELGGKLNSIFDIWIRNQMEEKIPDLKQGIDAIFQRYERERARKPDELFEEYPVDENEPDPQGMLDNPHLYDEDDTSSAETFFSWFFRGMGPSGVLSGAAFQKNRLTSASSAYATLFEDNHLAWLLGRPDEPLRALSLELGKNQDTLSSELRSLAFGYFQARSQQKEGFPRLYVFEAYQAAGLKLLAAQPGELRNKANAILLERYQNPSFSSIEPPAGFPETHEAISPVTFFTELAKRPPLKRRLWPDEQLDSFRESFRRQEQRRELISAMARLGASFIDLYLLAIKDLGSFELRRQAESQGRPEENLARAFVSLLESQMNNPAFHAYRELSSAAENFDLLISVNFPEVPSAKLYELAGIYAATLQKQVPVGCMSGGVNKRMVRQFRMPGFPLALVTTDVLQEGEDLHTFCRNVVHYGITWTPSAMEQRTGRIDRIGSLTQRRLDGRATSPENDEFLQVYYPHLRDTVEVLQVRRVLQRLNQFLRLIHKKNGNQASLDSRINAAREIVEELSEIHTIQEPLESAFPVSDEWLKGELKADDIIHPDVKSQEIHLDHLWHQFSSQYQIESNGEIDPRIKEASASIYKNHMLKRNSPHHPQKSHSFHIELRSQAAGDATLLRCISPVENLTLTNDDVLDEIYEIQKEMGNCKICVRPDIKDRRDKVNIEGDVLFHPKTTDFEEMETLIIKTVNTAVQLKERLLGGT